MIQEYNRPATLEAALALLARPSRQRCRWPAAPHWPVRPGADRGGGFASAWAEHLPGAGNLLHLGATLTLQSLLDHLSSMGAAGAGLTAGLQKAITHEATYNLRMAATVAGTLVASSGRSPFTTALLALDAALLLQPGDEEH